MSGYIVFTEKFYNNNQDISKAFLLAVEEAVNLINNQDERALKFYLDE